MHLLGTQDQILLLILNQKKKKNKQKLEKKNYTKKVCGFLRKTQRE